MLMTIVTGTWIGWLTVYAVSIVPIVTNTLAALLSIQSYYLCLGMLMTDYSITRISDFLTDKSVTRVTRVTFTVVVSFGLNSVEWNAFGVDIAVVRITGIDWSACKSITIVSGATGAKMVVNTTSDTGCTFSVCVTTPVVNCARVYLDTFATVFFVAVITGAAVTWVEICTGRIDWADAVGFAVVDCSTCCETVSFVMFYALTIVSHRQVNTLGILVTCGFASFTFVNWTDEGVVITCEPLFPFGLVCWRALGEYVVEKGLDSSKEISGVDNIVEVN